MSIGEMTAYALAVLLALVLCRIFIKPMKFLGQMALHSALGGVFLYIFNMAFAQLGLSVGLNIATAAVCGLLGLPGFVLLILLKIVYGLL